MPTVSLLDIQKIVVKIDDATRGEALDHIILAAFSYTLICANPAIVPVQLVEGVKLLQETLGKFTADTIANTPVIQTIFPPDQPAIVQP